MEIQTIAAGYIIPVNKVAERLEFNDLIYKNFVVYADLIHNGALAVYLLSFSLGRVSLVRLVSSYTLIR